jgi:hypothetical protein
LYQAAWTAEGDDMMTSMRSARFGDKLDRKAYYGFIKILCGIERVEHAFMTNNNNNNIAFCHKQVGVG